MTGGAPFRVNAPDPRQGWCVNASLLPAGSVSTLFSRGSGIPHTTEQELSGGHCQEEGGERAQQGCDLGSCSDPRPDPRGDTGVHTVPRSDPTLWQGPGLSDPPIRAALAVGCSPQPQTVHCRRGGVPGKVNYFYLLNMPPLSRRQL